MVAWLISAWRKIFGTGPDVTVTTVPAHVCPTCGQAVAAAEVETVNYENWTPPPAPPDAIEQADEKTDHVFAAHTYYHVASKQAGAFDNYPSGEGDPENFAILRSSRKLPAQFDADGNRIRQMDLDKLEELADKAFLLSSSGETKLDNVFDADKLSDEEFASLWLQGSEKDLAYWSQKATDDRLQATGEEVVPKADSRMPNAGAGA